jgi:LAO/AO transport system kinase
VLDSLAQVQQLVDGVLKGDKRCISRVMSLLENETPEAFPLISKLYPYTGKAHVIGVTGPGGSGKSTLVGAMVKELRKQGKTVGVVAVDPSSPFTGGAFLGDRIRMQELSVDEGVFIRSMATRNSMGGLAKATKDVILVLDASGKDVVIVETVGAGQSEVDVIKVAHTVVVVFAPGLGDEIQAIKAGIMEIGDVFVINKADRENANKAVSDIEAMLKLNSRKDGWEPPIIKTTAITGEGTQALLQKIEEHKKYLQSGMLEEKRKKRIETELIEAIKEKLANLVIEELKKKGEWETLVNKILTRETDPYTAANALLKKITKS